MREGQGRAIQEEVKIKKYRIVSKEHQSWAGWLAERRGRRGREGTQLRRGLGLIGQAPIFVVRL